MTAVIVRFYFLEILQFETFSMYVNYHYGVQQLLLTSKLENVHLGRKLLYLR